MTHLAQLPEAFLLVIAGGLLVALVAALARLVRGPGLPDRVVAFDLINLILIGLIALAAMRFETPALLDAALILALVAFVATVAFARFILDRGQGGGEA